ncbi:MAG: hypothetical protein LBH30_05240, partial [Prevotellaceae bacterium]|nr:hypothetical protein [Prevotellaceae bacterium]
IHCAFKALSGTVSIIPVIVFFSKISCKTITFRVYKSVVPKELFERILFKDANNIWWLGKNNFTSLGACR